MSRGGGDSRRSKPCILHASVTLSCKRRGFWKGRSRSATATCKNAVEIIFGRFVYARRPFLSMHLFVRRRGESEALHCLVYAKPLLFTPADFVRRHGDPEGSGLQVSHLCARIDASNLRALMLKTPRVSHISNLLCARELQVSAGVHK